MAAAIRTPSATRPLQVEALAAEQFGVVTRAQLAAAGLTDAAIARWVERRRLLRLHPGVYAVGHRALMDEGHWLAGVLAGGPGAVLSHETAAYAHGLIDARRPRIHVTIRHGAARRSRALWAHRCKLTDDDVTVLRGIPITTVERTLLDHAERASQRQVDRAVVQAWRLKVYDEQAMGLLLERSHGRHGLKRLRRSVARLLPDAARTRSELEERALAMCDRHDLPRPEINESVCGFDVDLYWPRQRLVVELDSRAFHLDPVAFEEDRRRDAELTRAGHEVLRFTWTQTTTRPQWVAGTIATVLRHRSR